MTPKPGADGAAADRDARDETWSRAEVLRVNGFTPLRAGARIGLGSMMDPTAIGAIVVKSSAGPCRLPDGRHHLMARRLAGQCAEGLADMAFPLLPDGSGIVQDVPG